MGQVENFVDDLLDDGKLTEGNRDRLVRAGRTLGQAVAAAVVTTVGDSLLNVVQDQEPLNVRTLGKAAVMAAVTAVVAYFHKRKV